MQIIPISAIVAQATKDALHHAKTGQHPTSPYAYHPAAESEWRKHFNVWMAAYQGKQEEVTV